jgi:quercetin dioxygenase-like cupin family protein
MPTTPYHAAFADMPREKVLEQVFERTAVLTDGAIVTFNWIWPGHPEPPAHDHPYDQLAIILLGALELDLDGTTYTVSGGEFLYIPAGVPHSGRVVSDEPCLNVDVFAPARQDYVHLAGHQPGQQEDEPATTHR